MIEARNNTVTHTLSLNLSGDEMDALWRVSREDLPGYTLEALGRKLIQDELVRMGVLALPGSNRSKGAQRMARKVR